MKLAVDEMLNIVEENMKKNKDTLTHNVLCYGVSCNCCPFLFMCPSLSISEGLFANIDGYLIDILEKNKKLKFIEGL